MTRRMLLLIALVAGLVPAAGASESRGLVLARKARNAADVGDYELARELLDQARIEWPGSTILAHTNGDVLAEMGETNAALDSYIKGLGQPHAFRSYFNQGVVRSDAAELALAQAGVPLDPAGLPEQVPAPGDMIAAIDAAMGPLQASRTNFLDALREQPDEAARESVAALTRRMDDLLEMREELERQLEEQQQEQEQEEQQDGEGEQDQQDQEQQDEGDKQDQQQDQQESDQDGEQPQDEPPQPESGEDEQEPTDDQQVPQPQAQPQELTPQQLEELLSQLEALEEKARELQALRRAAQRRGVEKDW